MSLLFVVVLCKSNNIYVSLSSVAVYFQLELLFRKLLNKLLFTFH